LFNDVTEDPYTRNEFNIHKRKKVNFSLDACPAFTIVAQQFTSLFWGKIHSYWITVCFWKFTTIS